MPSRENSRADTYSGLFTTPLSPTSSYKSCKSSRPRNVAFPDTVLQPSVIDINATNGLPLHTTSNDQRVSDDVKPINGSPSVPINVTPFPLPSPPSMKCLRNDLPMRSLLPSRLPSRLSSRDTAQFPITPRLYIDNSAQSLNENTNVGHAEPLSMDKKDKKGKMPALSHMLSVGGGRVLSLAADDQCVYVGCQSNDNEIVVSRQTKAQLPSDTDCHYYERSFPEMPYDPYSSSWVIREVYYLW